MNSPSNSNPEVEAPGSPQGERDVHDGYGEEEWGGRVRKIRTRRRKRRIRMKRRIMRKRRKEWDK